jgi:predicted PurR-regulated permease PerM
MEEAAEPRPEPSHATRATPIPPGPAPFVERRATAGGSRLRPPTPRVALMLFAAIVVAFVLYLGRDALSPFIVGLLLVFLLDPAVERLGRLGLPRGVAILLVYAVVVALIAVALNLAIPPLVEQVGQFIGDTPKLAGVLQDQLESLRRTYLELEIPPQVRAAIDRSLEQVGRDAGTINPGLVVPVFTSVAGFVATVAGYIIIPVWIFYLLKDRPGLTVSFDRSLPTEWREDTWAVIRIAERVFGQWVRGEIILGSTVALATFIGLELLSITVDPVFGRFAFFLAILAGLLELLPIIGPIIAAVPVILVGATAGVEATIAAFILTLMIQQVENYLLVPKIQGDATKLHPAVVMFALIIGAAIAGLLGAILALPVTAAGRDIYRYLFRRLSAPTTAAPVATEVVATDAADAADALEGAERAEHAKDIQRSSSQPQPGAVPEREGSR